MFQRSRQNKDNTTSPLSTLSCFRAAFQTHDTLFPRHKHPTQSVRLVPHMAHDWGTGLLRLSMSVQSGILESKSAGLVVANKQQLVILTLLLWHLTKVIQCVYDQCHCS